MRSIYVQNRLAALGFLMQSGWIAGSTLADIGARGEELKVLLPENIDYTGFDLYPVRNSTRWADIEQGIGSEEKFDIVVALDVLEHTNDIEKSICECLKICRGNYVFNLPNELWLPFRIRLMRGLVSGKFHVNLSNSDRHRWFFFEENVKKLAMQSAMKNTDYEIVALYKKTRVWGRLLWLLSYLGLHSLGASSFLIVGKVNDRVRS